MNEKTTKSEGIHAFEFICNHSDYSGDSAGLFALYAKEVTAEKQQQIKKLEEELKETKDILKLAIPAIEDKTDYLKQIKELKDVLHYIEDNHDGNFIVLGNEAVEVIKQALV